MRCIFCGGDHLERDCLIPIFSPQKAPEMMSEFLLQSIRMGRRTKMQVTSWHVVHMGDRDTLPEYGKPVLMVIRWPEGKTSNVEMGHLDYNEQYKRREWYLRKVGTLSPACGEVLYWMYVPEAPKHPIHRCPNCEHEFVEKD
jgi:hypothetical protein